MRVFTTVGIGNLILVRIMNSTKVFEFTKLNKNNDLSNEKHNGDEIDGYF